MITYLNSVKLIVIALLFSYGCGTKKAILDSQTGIKSEINKIVIAQGDNNFQINSDLSSINLEAKMFSLSFLNEETNDDSPYTRVAALRERKLIDMAEVGATANDVIFLNDYTRMAADNNHSYGGTLVLTDQAHQGLFYSSEAKKSVELAGIQNNMLELVYEVTSFHGWDGSVNKWREFKISEVDDCYLVVWTDRNQNKIIDKDEIGKAHIVFN